MSNSYDTQLDFNRSSAPPPYQSISSPLPRQQLKFNEEYNYMNVTNNTLKSLKEYASNSISSIEAATSYFAEEDTSPYTFSSRFPMNKLLQDEEKSIHMNNKLNSEGILSLAVNDTLERIGNSLQHLISEAEASLIGPSNDTKNNSNLYPPSQSFIDQHEKTLTDYYSFHVQQGQEKITVAMDQLEQSIQTMFHFNDFNKREETHLHYDLEEDTMTKKMDLISPDKKDKKRKRRKRTTWITIIVLIVIGYTSIRRSRKNQYGSLCLFLVLLLSIYRKKNIKRRFPIMNTIDRCIVQLVLSKGIPPILGFIHHINILSHCLTRYL